MDTLQIGREISLNSFSVVDNVGTNRCWPGKVTIVPNEIQTTFLIYAAINSVIFPTSILIPSSMDVMNIVIGFNNFLIIFCAKLWTINTEYPVIKVSNALESKSRVTLLTLGMVIIAGQVDHYRDYVD